MERTWCSDLTTPSLCASYFVNSPDGLRLAGGPMKARASLVTRKLPVLLPCLPRHHATTRTPPQPSPPPTPPPPPATPAPGPPFNTAWQNSEDRWVQWCYPHGGTVEECETKLMYHGGELYQCVLHVDQNFACKRGPRLPRCPQAHHPPESTCPLSPSLSTSIASTANVTTIIATIATAPTVATDTFQSRWIA